MSEIPDNDALVQAIEVMNDSVAELMPVYLESVLKRLVASSLLIPTDEEVARIDADGDELLAVFTDPVELGAFEAGAAFEVVAAETIIRRVAEGRADGFVINPAGRAFELSREDVLEFFEVDV